MTRDKWIKMTPDEKRIKIAELCGWTRIRSQDDAVCPIEDIGCGFVGLPPNQRENVLWAEGDGRSPEVNWPIPDYLNDISAVHDAEFCLDHLWDDKYPGASAWDEFMKNLEIIVGSRGYVDVWKATAAQRAEALVLTMEPE